jgi:hypothetical protein
LKEHLDDAIARHEQIAAEVERAYEPDAASPHDKSAELSSETPGRCPGVLDCVPVGTTNYSGLGAGDYSSPGA